MPLTPLLRAVIVALPAPRAVTMPVLETVAALVSLLDHVMIDPVSTLPLSSFTVAWSCCVAPCVNEIDEGETVTLAATDCATTTLTLVFFLPAEAVTVVVPEERPVTSPLPLTEASVGSPDNHDTVVVIVCPCELRTFAVSCAVCLG